MGSNRRYASSVDRQMDARVLEKIMRSGDPLTLTEEERQLDIYPLTVDPRANTVRAWVRYPAAAVQVDARAVKWTPRAVALTWAGPDDSEHRAWVWASAVEGRS